ncbi:MAG TPA: LysE family translocator [Actinophytocola sp.]|uniref:LysE family translocator n=1 Tax=Actinophytocola sp. TaxID=1872138 RepID=UPI002DBF006D|nr:LysE family translocator [Actinophytocola sp.]HEU5472939.1 LysE family translocator [Actinophytocola sp.]
MPSTSTILLFLAVTATLFLIPGPSVLYIVTRSVAQGRAAGLISVLGMHVGTIPYMLATALGLSALLTASSTAFHIIRYLGAAYLIWLGVQKLWSLRKQGEADSEPPTVSLARIFRQAVVVSILNPKTLIFFAALLPQFIDPSHGSVAVQVAFFCAGFLVLGVISDGTYALLSSTLAGRLRHTARSRRVLDRFSGIVYLMLGAFAAVIAES